MNLKPDLGKAYLDMGYDQSTIHYWYDLLIDHISVIGGGQFCITVDTPVEGVLHCATFDFDLSLLKELLKKAPAESQRIFIETLMRDPDNPGTIDLPQAFQTDLGATLGQPVSTQYEVIVPFQVREFP